MHCINIFYTSYTASARATFKEMYKHSTTSGQIFIEHLGGLKLCQVLGDYGREDSFSSWTCPSYWGDACLRQWLPDLILLEELRCNANIHASKVFAQTAEQIWYLHPLCILLACVFPTGLVNTVCRPRGPWRELQLCQNQHLHLCTGTKPTAELHPSMLTGNDQVNTLFSWCLCSPVAVTGFQVNKTVLSETAVDRVYILNSNLFCPVPMVSGSMLHT